MPHDAAVSSVEELVELHQGLRDCHVAIGERVERSANHLLVASAHLLEGDDQPLIGVIL